MKPLSFLPLHSSISRSVRESKYLWPRVSRIVPTLLLDLQLQVDFASELHSRSRFCYQKCRFAKARPEPLLRYFSNSIARSFSSTWANSGPESFPSVVEPTSPIKRPTECISARNQPPRAPTDFFDEETCGRLFSGPSLTTQCNSPDTN